MMVRRFKRKGSPKIHVRMLLPMSIRCNSCGKYVYKGTKLNPRREEAEISPAGIQRFRFYFNCTGCSAELAIKTDPHYPHFTVESGATRTVSTDDKEEACATRSVSTDEEAGAQSSPEKKFLAWSLWIMSQSSFL